MTNKKGKDKYTIQAEKRYSDQYKSDLKASNQLYDKQAKNTNKDYDTQIFEQGRAYEDQYRDNAVQKEINKRQVSESMANLGLRDSGLNRTQQTAVQLSYGNNKANIDRQRQAGIDSLNYSRRQAIDTIKLNKASAKAEIDSAYKTNVRSYADVLREKDEAAAETKKTENKSLVLSYLEIGAEPPKDVVAASGMTASEINAYKGYYKKTLQKSKTSGSTTKNSSDSVGDEETKYKVLSFGGSGIDDDGNTVYYVYDENGTKRTYPAGINPYTNQPITGGYTTEDLKTVGVWNGYQPKAVKENGVLLDIHQYAPDGTPVQVPHQGHYKRIWQTNDGRLWIWDDFVGNYVPAQDDDIQ